MSSLRVGIIFLLLFSSRLVSQETSHNYSSVPQWAKSAVWYQIFPERFANGDKTNDPTIKDLEGSWPHETPKAWSVSSWTGDWYALQPWESDTSGGRGFYFQVQRRRYGGDLQGIIDRLDYLSHLGINAIYLNPIFESPSLHKYDAGTYHHVDKNFGPDPSGDAAIRASEDPADPTTWKWTSADKLFLKLVEEAHRRGMHIILDGVFNHVGYTFWAFQDVIKNQQQSKYKDWFMINRWDDPATPQNEFDYHGWYDVRELPEWREDSLGIVPGPREYIHAIVKRWMDPNGDGNPSDGIDGWRLDVANMVGMPFWRDFRTWVRGINPEAYITGEVWWDDWGQNKMFNAAPWLAGDAFDAVMNYRWAAEVCHFFIDRKLTISPSEFDKRLAALRSDYLTDVNFVLMNLLDSHDTDRLGSRIVNPDMIYDHAVGVPDTRTYQVRKPAREELQTQKLMAMFQMTYLGAPMIYYGDEVGMWGGDDPDERKPMLWSDFRYVDEVSHPFGMPRQRDKNAPNMELYAYYARIIGIRNSHTALSVGTYTTLLTDDARGIVAFRRSAGTSHAVVALNTARRPCDVFLPLENDLLSLRWKNVLDETRFVRESGGLRVRLAPRSGIILAAERP